MFSRPVDPTFPIHRYYGEKDAKYDWSIEPENGVWLPVKDPDGKGHHRGTDFDCPLGAIVRAMCDGMILRARHEKASDPKYGAGLYILQLVSMMGYDNWVLKYSHLKAVYVTPGQQVYRQDAMAESGEGLHVDLMDLRLQWKPIPLES